MLNVVCVRVGQKYSPDYVFKLRNMVSRHLKEEHNFYCITENPIQVKGVDTIPAPLQIPDSWCKIGLFFPKLKEVKTGDRMLYLDLDVVITGSLDALIKDKLGEGQEKDFWIVKDWRDPYNSSVMYWTHGEQTRIFAKFKGKLDMQRLRGDQNLIAEVKTDAKTFNKKDVLSYKFDNVGNDKKPTTKIVLFHGKPKMADLPDVEWINKEWR